jgi:hypothetical protein
MMKNISIEHIPFQNALPLARPKVNCLWWASSRACNGSSRLRRDEQQFVDNATRYQRLNARAIIDHDRANTSVARMIKTFASTM